MKSIAPQTDSTDVSKPERSWRFHPVSGADRQTRQDSAIAAMDDQSTVVSAAAKHDAHAAPPSTPVSSRTGWLDAALDRAADAFPRFEPTLHRFTIEIQAANDAAQIEAALLSAASKVYPKGRFEFLGLRAVSNDQDALNHESTNANNSQNTAPAGHRDLPLTTGNAFHGRLRLRSGPGKSSSHSATVIQRLNTLCILAASALENLRHHTEWSRHLIARPDADHESPCFSPLTFDPTKPPVPAVCSSLRDATFLSAIFPFALSQAQRYRESLSILCVGVDRIGGIRELLGNEVASRLIERVGQIVAATIRSSDIVARLDDDRIVALLVRAPGYSAMHVAESVCRTVAQTPNAIPELPSVSISVGVAAFPSHALNGFALLDAADNALSQAQSRGFGTVAIAPKNQALPGSTQPTAATDCH
jgi:diguanylate cyclase (GGDEF)-like protein